MLADVLEAVVAACYLHCGIQSAVFVVDRLGVAPIQYIFEAMRRHTFAYYLMIQ